MLNSKTQHIESYFDTYVQEIEPRLQDIDILLKTANEPISIYVAAELLDIEATEVINIMRQLNTNELTANIFTKIMEHGSSEFCRMFKRELDCGSPHTYTAQDISYIYGIDLELVKLSFSSINATKITSATLPYILTKIPIK